MSAGPDFLCIGMQKAGTSWLYDQLQYHSDFWMPPIKEFHYFDKKKVKAKDLASKVADQDYSLEDLNQKREIQNLRPLDERDMIFLRDYAACEGQTPDVDVYANLFRHKGDRLSGDITPAYSKLDDESIQTITARFPALKILLLVRDPVSRAWSQLSMNFKRGRLTSDVVDDFDALEQLLHKRMIESRGFPTQIYARWRRHVPTGQLHHVFFDTIASEPDLARQDVLKFLGADPAKDSGGLQAGYNRKSAHPKLEMSDGAREILAHHFRDEIRACAEMFGGPATAWPARYGL